MKASWLNKRRPTNDNAQNRRKIHKELTNAWQKYQSEYIQGQIVCDKDGVVDWCIVLVE